MRVLQTSGYAEGTLLDFKPRIGQAEINIERASVPNLSARHAWLRLDGQQSNLGYQARIGVDERRSLYLKGGVDFSERRGVLEQLDMYLNEKEWHLGVPAEILAEEGIRIRYFVLESQEQEITLDGILNPDGRAAFGGSVFTMWILLLLRMFLDSLVGRAGICGFVLQWSGNSPGAGRIAESDRELRRRACRRCVCPDSLWG